MENQSSTTKVIGKPLKSFNGEVFGKLTIIKDCGHVYFPTSRPKRRVLCKCECGKEKELTLADVKSGRIQSCGCYHLMVTKNTNTRHGMRQTRFYQIYLGIKKRCENPNEKYYLHYGGRGIKNEFKSFEHFKETMLRTYIEGLSIERIDVNGNYSPSNCEWIPISQQGWNKTNSIIYKGVPLTKYCNDNSLNHKLISGRLTRGWDIEKAIKTPKMAHRYNKQETLF